MRVTLRSKLQNGGGVLYNSLARSSGQRGATPISRELSVTILANRASAAAPIMAALSVQNAKGAIVTPTLRAAAWAVI